MSSSDLLSLAERVERRVSITGMFLSATSLCWLIVYLATVPPIFGQLWLMLVVHGAGWAVIAKRCIFCPAQSEASQ